MLRVVIGTPAYSGITVGYLHSLIKTLGAATANGILVTVDTEEGSSIITAARNKTVRRFLDSGADVLFFIDSDMAWEPEAFIKLATCEHDVAACAYRMKRTDSVEHYTCLINSGPDGCPIVKDGWIDCEAAGTGFMAIKRHVFDRIEAPEFSGADGTMKAWFDFEVHSGRYWGEDYTFCRRAGGVMVWPDAKFAHYGQSAWVGNLHEFLLRSANA